MVDDVEEWWSQSNWDGAGVGCSDARFTIDACFSLGFARWGILAGMKQLKLASFFGSPSSRTF